MPNSEEIKKNAGDAAQQAKEKAGQVAHDNKDKFAGMLGKLSSKIDEKTQGKYHDKLEKAQDAALKGADKLAEQRPGVVGAGEADDAAGFADAAGTIPTDGPATGNGQASGDGQVPRPTDPGQTPPSGS